MSLVLLSRPIEYVAGRLGALLVRWCNDRRKLRRFRHFREHSSLGMLLRVYGFWMIHVRDPIKHSLRRRKAKQ